MCVYTLLCCLLRGERVRKQNTIVLNVNEWVSWHAVLKYVGGCRRIEAERPGYRHKPTSLILSSGKKVIFTSFSQFMEE